MTTARCTKCILPSNYPGIKFDEHGVCNICASHRPIDYLGGEVLRERIKSASKQMGKTNAKYDCVLGLSGGRDSSYLLYYLVKKLDLKLLAFSADNGFLPDETKKNLKRMSEIMGVDLVMQKNDYLARTVRHHIKSWIREPSAAMVGLFCTGCRLGIDKGIEGCAKKNNVAVIISGGTPFEGKGYKLNLLRRNPNNRTSSILIGYLSQILRNPKWILNPTSLSIQAREYYYHYRARGHKGTVNVAPFYGFIRWEERKIISTIERELEWKKDPRVSST
jgi:hypothetical protein